MVGGEGPNNLDEKRPGATNPAADGGLVHAYFRYDPLKFPSPQAAADAPDLAGAAMEHMLLHGDMRELTAEELARAVRLDPSMFPMLGPSLASLRALLEERKRKILETYETGAAEERSRRDFDEAAADLDVPEKEAQHLARAVRERQMPELERIWYRQKREGSPFAKGLVRLIDLLGTEMEIAQLANRYAFRGRQEMTPSEALEIKEELEAIDKLLKQLEDAAKNAQIGIIDIEELSRFADAEQIEDLNRLSRTIEDYLRTEMERQGIEGRDGAMRLSPRAVRLFQKKVLREIFSELEASRRGRHEQAKEAEGPIEMARTRPYEFGDSGSSIDPVTTLLNSAARGRGRIDSEDIEVHRSRIAPRCATAIVMDMSGSMRYGGQYAHVKRMALAMDGLIRADFPGDSLFFIEMFTLAKVRAPSEVPGLLPKPVSIHNPVVRLRADMSDPDASELRLPQHFTNIQHGLRQARRLLSVQPTPNRQIVLITDGLPTAHFEDEVLYMLYPPDPRTEAATMREARLCSRDGITINIFLLPNWSQSEEDVRFAHAMATQTRGRVFFTGGKDLDRYVLWDYVSNRRSILG